MKDNKIINENNYSNYIKYLESNLIGLSVMKIFIYRLLTSIKGFLYIDKTGDLKIIEEGRVFVKRAQNEKDYLLTRMDESNYYSLFLKNSNEKQLFNLNNYSVIKHKLFKKIYLIYPSQDNLLKYISKEGKVNLVIFLLMLIFLILGMLALIGII